MNSISTALIDVKMFAQFANLIASDYLVALHMIKKINSC